MLAFLSKKIFLVISGMPRPRKQFTVFEVQTNYHRINLISVQMLVDNSIIKQPSSFN